MLKADAGLLTFTDGQRHTSVNVTILRSPNSTEGNRTFDVELLNPSGGASIGIASTVSVTLLAGTRAFGVFYFADHSLSETLAEDLDGPVVEATFEVTNTSTFAVIFVSAFLNMKLHCVQRKNPLVFSSIFRGKLLGCYEDFRVRLGDSIETIYVKVKYSL